MRLSKTIPIGISHPPLGWKPFVSHRFHEAHEDCIAKGSQLSALPSAYDPDGKHERKRRALCEIRAICVRINYLSRKKEVCL